MTSSKEIDSIPVLVFGASGQAEVVTDILSSNKEYSISAYVDNTNRHHSNNRFLDRLVLRTVKEVKEIFEEGVRHAIVAIGDIKTRVKFSQILIDAGFSFINAIHQTSVLSVKTEIGINTIIKAGAILDPRVTIGNHSYIGAGVTVGHNCKIGEFVSIAGGSKISGHVTIGDRVFIGTGSSIKDRITIGAGATVGIGSVVISDIPTDTTVKGIPAK